MIINLIKTKDCKLFGPRSISSLSSVIVRVSVVLKTTVFVDIDSRFDNLNGSHLQSHDKTKTEELSMITIARFVKSD